MPRKKKKWAMPPREWLHGKGHWPKGKRRNQPPNVALMRLRKVLRHPVRGVISRRVVAECVGAHSRSVGRWLSREDWPSKGAILKLVRWLNKIEKLWS